MIRLERVTKAFGLNVVLKELDLEVPTGRTLAVLGRSGSGKSVLLKHVARLLRPDSGTVRVGELEISAASEARVKEARRSMGYVFQFAALFDSMTIGENVGLPLRRTRVGRGEVEDRVAGVLETVGLAGLQAKYPAELSGGMRKRAGIARAVVARPSYLLYDEPTTGLDPVTTSMIDELILRLKDEIRATSIVVTHDIQSAFRVADRVALLHERRLWAEGTPEEFHASEDTVVRAFVEGRQDLWPEEL